MDSEYEGQKYSLFPDGSAFTSAHTSKGNGVRIRPRKPVDIEKFMLKHGSTQPLPRLEHKPSHSRRSKTSLGHTAPAFGFTHINTKNVKLSTQMDALMFNKNHPTLVPKSLHQSNHEVKELQAWASRYLRRNNHRRGKTSDDLKTIVGELQMYAQCYFDLIRQCTVHSPELGHLQAMLWNDFVGLFQRLFSLHESHQTEIDMKAEHIRNEIQNEALQDRSQLRQREFELEEKLRMQEETIRRKDRALQLNQQHQTHLEQENAHLREMLAADSSEQRLGVGKMVDQLDKVVEDVENETRDQHDICMNMKRLVDQIQIETGKEPPKMCDIGTGITEEDRAELEEAGKWFHGVPAECDDDEHKNHKEPGICPKCKMPDVHVCAKKRRRASVKPKQEPQSWATWFATHKPKDGTVCQSLRGLEKFISQVYFDKIVADEVDDRENKGRETMPQFVFEIVLNKYGLKSLANKHMHTILASIYRHHKDSKRVRLFAQFCGVPIGVRGLDLNHLNFYLYLTKYAHGNPKKVAEELGLGLRCLEQSPEESIVDITDADHLMAWLHSECFRSHRDVLHEASAKLRTRIEPSLTPSGSGRKMLLYEDMVDVVLEQWDKEVAHTTQTLETMFAAADVDGNGVLTFDEFASLVWAIAPTFSTREVTAMFWEAQTEENDMSPASFVRVASQHGLLSTLMKNKEFGAMQQMDNWSLLEAAWEEEEAFSPSIDQLTGVAPVEFLELQNTRAAKLTEMIENRTNLQEAWLSFRTLGSSLERAVRKYCLHEDSQDEAEADSPEDGRSGGDEVDGGAKNRRRRASIFGMQEGVKNLRAEQAQGN